jgi:hypothetical protein
MPTINGYGPKRAILYTRVSTDEQARSEYSLAQQLEALCGYAIVRATRSSRRSQTLARAGQVSSGLAWPEEGLSCCRQRVGGASSR